jgi:hypothetical protein
VDGTLGSADKDMDVSKILMNEYETISWKNLL